MASYRVELGPIPLKAVSNIDFNPMNYKEG